MILNIFHILPLLQFLQLADEYLETNIDDNYDSSDNIHILGFIKILPLIIELITQILDYTEENPRDNDAYKLIRYFAEYR